MRDSYEFEKDYDSSSDMLEDVLAITEWSRKDPIFDAIYEFVEINAYDEIRTATKRLRRLYGCMLKFKYQRDKQMVSWMNTIINASKALGDVARQRKNIKNRLSDDVLDSCYEEAVIDAVSGTDLSKKEFPKDRPEEWSLNNIGDPEYIRKYIYEYKYTKDVDKLYADIYGEEG